MTDDQPKRTIGYYITKKKIKQLNISTFVALANHHHYNVVAIDPKRPIEMHLDLFIFKLNKEIVAAKNGDEVCEEIVKNVREFVQRNPQCVVVDSIEVQVDLLNRDTMDECVRRIADGSGGLIRAPRAVVLEEGDVLDEDFPFPAICKNVVAGGSDDSHVMGIVFNRLSAVEWERPCLVQEYINHDATIDKVFVVGQHSKAVRRPSLKNFSAGDDEPLIFNSQNMKNIIGNPNDYSVPTLNEDTLHQISQIVVEQSGSHLTGYDLIRNKDTGEFCIIDMNYFPGYIGYENFDQHLLDLVESLLE